MIAIKHLIESRVMTYILICHIFVFSISSCVFEDTESCDTEIAIKKTTLSVSVFNAAGQNITTTGVAGDVHLFVFDDNQKFVDEIIVKSIEIQNNTPITIGYKDVTNYWVVAWGNLNSKQKVTQLTKGMSIEEGLVQLEKNVEGYAINPDDLFWGIQFCPSSQTKAGVDTKTENITLEMRRMTARMAITVIGLNPQLNDYRFIISGSNEDTYTFNGNLVGSPIAYKEDGMFDPNSNFVSLLPFSMFPLTEGDYNTISIYQGNNLIVSVHTNSVNGANIVPIVGVTNNILIDLTGQLTEMEATIKVSDWNTVHQWVEW